MRRSKILLVGNSGIGKSVCSDSLAVDARAASMDKRFAGRDYPGLDESLDWILNGSGEERVLSAFSHEDFIWDLARAKNQRDPRLKSLLIVFLYNTDPDSRLKRLDQSGRKEEAKRTPLAWDAQTNDLGRFMADLMINTATMDKDEVASHVSAIRQNLTD